ncbi:MAG: GNAT family N-acetyltransferase [Deltaproteobacteria bacterium]|nr:GNAT family N-acetyltransferase [Deltaproteobacteria bacterium]
MNPGESNLACQFIHEVFDEFVSPYYSQEGVNQFHQYADPKLMAARLRSGHVAWVAETDGRIVGLIELRNLIHVSLLFVDGTMQRKGIGRQLFQQAQEWCRRNGREAGEITVHSSPNSVTAYERLGFHAEGPEQNTHGIRFVPMKFRS